ncbi:hypothetical protein G7Y89_g4114 [Cudoniella acicularis]|uniref:Pre-mRNA-splicing factor 38B n=1 Tax=Cudoniella acicularis TaxID=354080 RepID=A0A8H4RQ31_9HELO|nr:hypothetical protein G7Y89_g4114 [Cudoniella acicularis]
MANEGNLSDEYVAGLLAKDAKESTIKYSAVGLEGFTNSKPPANKPKPNTRFLRNIIKDTDSHNAALLAKEAAESRARLQGLASNEYREQKASQIGGGDIRRRQLGDIAAILGGRPAKRRRTEDLKATEKVSRRRNTSSEDDEPKKRVENERVKEEKSHKRRSRDEEVDNYKSSSYRSHRRRHRSTSREVERTKDDKGKRHRSRSRSRSRSPREHRNKESRHRHRSPKRRRSRSPDKDREKSRKSRRSPSDERKPARKQSKKSKQEGPAEDEDSDPLDDIIGPRPPPIPEVRSRGRGTVSQASGIDSRFSADYDPSTDVQLDADEENDWDQALEALRDRQKWKQQGADRLRAAGFTDDEIKKWEKGGEKREEDVKWAKKGESREWDRGKVIDDEGAVTIQANFTEPEFGRLKDA